MAIEYLRRERQLLLDLPRTNRSISIDLQRNVVTIDGNGIHMEPKHAIIINELVEARLGHRHSVYVKGPEILQLYGCQGLNVSRVIKDIKREHPERDAIRVTIRHC